MCRLLLSSNLAYVLFPADLTLQSRDIQSHLNDLPLLDHQFSELVIERSVLGCEQEKLFSGLFSFPASRTWERRFGGFQTWTELIFYDLRFVGNIVGHLESDLVL